MTASLMSVKWKVSIENSFGWVDIWSNVGLSQNLRKKIIVCSYKFENQKGNIPDRVEIRAQHDQVLIWKRHSIYDGSEREPEWRDEYQLKHANPHGEYYELESR